MRAVDVIRKKRDGGELSPAEIDAFIGAIADGSWRDYQLSAMLMAIWLKGMTNAETAQLTKAMCDSGKRFNLSDIPGPKVDKHSTGGVGDKTSLIVAPLASACGVIVPMMSGRGLGHAGGTLDKIESIPGFRIHLDENELREALLEIGVAIIGQTATVAPADKALYALRDVTATVESIPLITSSILAKKLAEGIDGLVMDVKVGRGAYMKTMPEAKALAELIVSVGVANGVKTEALITAMDHPLGRAVGNSLEVIEAIETLKGNGPSDLETLSVLLVSRMARLAGLAKSDEEADQRVRYALESGDALVRLQSIISVQGGDAALIDDYRGLPKAPHRHLIAADRSGYVIDLNAEKIGIGTMLLGAGRERADDPIDRAVGVVIKAPVGTQVRPGDTILEIHYRDSAKLNSAFPSLMNAIRIGDEVPIETPLVYEVISG